RLEAAPWPIPQRGRRDHEDALPPLLYRLADQLTGDERLAQADTVRDNHAGVATEDHPRHSHAIALERREMKPKLISSSQRLDLSAVLLVQHPEVDQVRRVR